LSLGATLAELGHLVVCIDINSQLVEELTDGFVRLYEPGLPELVSRGRSEGRLTFSTDTRRLSECEFVFLCLPTPTLSSGSVDMSAIENVVPILRDSMSMNSVLVVKSTVPVGTNDWLADFLNRQDVAVVSNPEFVREGSTVADMFHPDRIVIGSRRREDAERVGELFTAISAPRIYVSPRSAEVIKYAANSFLAVKLSFVNEIARFCAASGASARDVLHAVGMDPRIGEKYLQPGPGWGGSCLPKDSQALITMAAKTDTPLTMVESAVRSNETTKIRWVRTIAEVAKTGNGRVHIMGLAFKAGTNDLRHSPAISIAQQLHSQGLTVSAYDPTVSAETDDFGTTIRLCSTLREGVSEASAIVVATDWPEFLAVKPEEFRHATSCRHVFDLRGALDLASWQAAGFSVVSSLS
jgi:UDPglucose 6-dehydrogenase